jgi:hypothetical protein
MIDLILIFCFVAIGFCHYKKAMIQYNLIKNEKDTFFIMKLFFMFNPFFVLIPTNNKNILLSSEVKKYRNYILILYILSILTILI